MRQRILAEVVIVLGVVLSVGAALAQTAGPTVPAPSRSIVPVTGPSTGPGPIEAAKPELVSLPLQTTSKVKAVKGSATRASVTGQPSRAVKVAHKPGVKTVVKKTPAPKRVTKVAGSAKTTKHGVAKKSRAPAAEAVVGKPNPTKRQSPVPTVLPRV